MTKSIEIYSNICIVFKHIYRAGKNLDFEVLGRL